MNTIAESFLEDFHHVSTIGATEHDGVERQAASEADGRTRDWFVAFAEAHDWRVDVDGVGNIFATLEFVPGAAAVLTGSHLDSQPCAGRFDGAYGVLASLHAAVEVERRVRAGELQPKHNLVVVNWFNEEGSRFTPSLMGSASFAGVMRQEDVLAAKDLQGTTVAEALEAIGYLGSGSGPERLAGYAEIHIEQGRILEREGIDLGAVEASWVTRKLDIDVFGEQAHSGATAMDDRRDALVSAAKLILLAREICADFPPDSIVSTIGQITVEPNVPIVVNSHVHLVADMRSSDPAIAQQARDLLVQRFQEVAEADGVRIVARDFDVRPARSFPPEGVELVERVAREADLSSRRIRTMAGHDTVPMNTVTPTVMLFAPSVEGASHCERELTRDEDLVQGLTGLTGVVAEMVAGALDGVAYPGSTPDTHSEER